MANLTEQEAACCILGAYYDPASGMYRTPFHADLLNGELLVSEAIRLSRNIPIGTPLPTPVPEEHHND